MNKIIPALVAVIICFSVGVMALYFLLCGAYFIFVWGYR